MCAVIGMVTINPSCPATVSAAQLDVAANFWDLDIQSITRILPDFVLRYWSIPDCDRGRAKLASVSTIRSVVFQLSSSASNTNSRLSCFVSYPISCTNCSSHFVLHDKVLAAI